MYQEIILDYFVIDCDILTFNNAVIFVSPLNKKKKTKFETTAGSPISCSK